MSIIKDFIVKAGLQIEGTSQAVSSSSAALQIPYGGAGIGGNILVAGTGTFGTVNPGTGSTSSISLQTLQVPAGGIGINGDSYFGSKLLVADQTFITSNASSSNPSSGALVVKGGAGIGANLYAGGDMYANSTGLVITTATIATYAVTSLTAGTDTVVSTSTGPVSIWNVSTLQTITDRGASTNNAISITNGTQSTTTSSGALQVAGSVSAWSNLNVGGTLNATSNLSVASTAGFYSTQDSSSITAGAVTIAGGLAVAKTIYARNEVITSVNASLANVADNALAITQGGLGVAAGLLVQGNSALGSGSNSINTNSTQAVLVTGGVGVSGNVVSGKVKTVDQTAADTSGNGSASIAGGAYVGDNLVVMSNASSATSTASNALYVAGSVGIGKNLYVTGEIIAQQLTIEYTTVTTTVVETDDVITTKNNTQATSTATGALQVPYGGAGIGRDLWVGGNQYVGGNVEIDGNLSFGSGTTASGSFAKFFGDIWGFDALYAGIEGYTPVAQAIAQYTANTSTYTQINFQNVNSGTQASADWCTTADNGTDGTGFADWGITNQNWDGTQPYSLGNALQPNDGYFYTFGGTGLGGNTVIGSTSATVKILSGGGDADDVVAVFTGINGGAKSISTATGALTVRGGVGIWGELNVGGNSRFNGTVTATNIVGLITTATNIANGDQWSLPIQYGVGQTGFIQIVTTTNFVLTTNGSSATWQALSSIPVGISNSTTNVALTTTNVSASFYIPFSADNNSYNALYVDSNITYNPNTDVISFGGATDSTTSTNGTVVVTGGVGIAKNIVVGTNATIYGTHTVLNNRQATNTASGALQIVGGVGVGADLYASRLFDNANRVVTQVNPIAGTAIGINNITNVGTATTFTINNFGVTALQGSTYIGVSASTGSITVQNFGVQTLTAGTDTALTLTGANTGTVTVWNTSNLQTVTQRGATTPYSITITSSTNATSTGSGALQVAGGVGISRDLWVGGTISRAGNLSGSAWNSNGIGLSIPAATYTDTSLTGAQTSTTVNSFGIPTIAASGGTPTFTDAANVYIAGAPTQGAGVTISNPWSLYIAGGKTKLVDPTNATTTATGALQVVGGVGVGGSIVAGGSITAGTAATGSPVIGLVSNNLTIASYTSSALGASSTGTTQTLDSWSSISYRSARYSVEVVDTGFSPNRIHFTEIVLIHDGIGNVYKSEYGIISNVGELGTFDAITTGSSIQLTFQPTWPALSAPSSLVIKAVRTSIN